MEVAGYIFGVIGGLLLGFPYLPFVSADKSVKLEGMVERSEIVGVFVLFGMGCLVIATIFSAFGIEGPRESDLNPLPLKTLAAGVLLLIIAAVWRMITAMTTLFKAGSRVLPAQLLGVFFVVIGAALTVGHMSTR